MKSFISNFDTTAELEAFSATSECLKPHVSLTQDNNMVHFIPYVETRVIAKFNVTDTSSPTQIIGEDWDEGGYSSAFTAIEIDGVAQQSLVGAYAFSTTNDLQTAISDVSGVQLRGGLGYWSSTEYGDYDAWSVYTYSGRVDSDSKNSSNYVRAFLAL